MRPELFDIPFLDVSVKSYGTMMVLGFLAATLLMRRMSRHAGQHPEWIINAALYSLFAGIVGAKVFYVAHHYDPSQPLGRLIFSGSGFEFLGGVVAAIVFLLIYFRVKKLPGRLYFDILAVGLMVGLGFGRIGCFMNGCCYGKPADVPLAVQFPYASLPYYSQIYPDEQRWRHEPRLDLPSAYFGWLDQEGNWIEASPENKHYAGLKPKAMLTPEQKTAVTEGPYRALPVHPTQIYASLNAFILAGAFYGLWRIIGLKRPGMVLGLVMIAYGVTRFGLEAMRDDNPFEYAWWMLYQGGTISQNLSIYLILTGAILLGVISKMKPCASADPHPGKVAKKR